MKPNKRGITFIKEPDILIIEIILLLHAMFRRLKCLELIQEMSVFLSLAVMQG